MKNRLLFIFLTLLFTTGGTCGPDEPCPYDECKYLDGKLLECIGESSPACVPDYRCLADDGSGEVPADGERGICARYSDEVPAAGPLTIADETGNFDDSCGGPGPFTTDGIPEADITEVVIRPGDGTLEIEMEYDGDAQAAWESGEVAFGVVALTSNNEILDAFKSGAGYKLSDSEASVTHEWLSPTRLLIRITNFTGTIVRVVANTFGSNEMGEYYCNRVIHEY